MGRLRGGVSVSKEADLACFECGKLARSWDMLDVNSVSPDPDELLVVVPSGLGGGFKLTTLLHDVAASGSRKMVSFCLECGKPGDTMAGVSITDI